MVDSTSSNPSRLALTGQAAGSANATPEQQAQLAKLHQAAQQMESLFVDMLFKEMRKSAPSTTLTGKVSNAEQTFSEMLDTKRAEELSQSGALGIGKILEDQLRASVLGDGGAAASPSAAERKQ